MRFDILVGILTVETILVLAFAVAWFEASIKSAHYLMEAVRGQGLEVVLLVDIIDWDSSVHLQTVQKEQ